MITKTAKLYKVERKCLPPALFQDMLSVSRLELLLGCHLSCQGNSTAVMLKPVVNKGNQR